MLQIQQAASTRLAEHSPSIKPSRQKKLNKNNQTWLV
jgi:hypothetical protein